LETEAGTRAVGERPNRALFAVEGVQHVCISTVVARQTGGCADERCIGAQQARLTRGLAW
jgi:hypothetical protein